LGDPNSRHEQRRNIRGIYRAGGDAEDTTLDCNVFRRRRFICVYLYSTAA
jgi:hypothetical protein